MKFIYFLPVLLLLAVGCEKKIPEVPDDISVVKPADDLADSLFTAFPEGFDIFENKGEFFADDIQKQIIIKEETEVYVTFIDEGASNRNSLCWYAYNQFQPPLTTGEITSNIVFPNISKVGEGGQLEPGNTLKLGQGKFPAGTVIGFFMVINGWEDGVINYDKPIVYTNFDLNPGGKQQHILYKDKNFKYLLVGFEDTVFDDGSDKDYNDIIFAVTDNNKGIEAGNFDLTDVLIE